MCGCRVGARSGRHRDENGFRDTDFIQNFTDDKGYFNQIVPPEKNYGLNSNTGRMPVQTEVAQNRILNKSPIRI